MQRFITWITSSLKWVLMVVVVLFILLLADVAFDLYTNEPIDARNAHFRKVERTFPSTDGTKAVKLVVFRDEPRSTEMMLDHGRTGCGIFHYPDTGLALAVRWMDNEHVKIIGPDSLRSGLNTLNDTCQSFRQKVYITFEAR